MGREPKESAHYESVHRMSIAHPEQFWRRASEGVHWFEGFNRVLDDSNPPFYRWFVGGKTNICYNAVDRHALGPKRGQAAVIWESPETGQSRVLTYFQLYREVNRFAGVLRSLGVEVGDRVIIYMPMVVEALVAMLACTRIGAIHSVVFAGFSVDSLAERIDDARPKLLITADAGRRKGRVVDLKGIVDSSLATARVEVERVIVLDRGLKDFSQSERDLLWDKAVDELGQELVEPIPLDSSHPSYILYTSGTTGKPKGVVRDTGGYMVALYLSMEQIYDVGEGDVYWSTSDIGWVVGHSYIVYGPLLKGIPTVVFEGTPDYPDPGVWWRVIEKYGVTVMFSAPTALRMLRKYPPDWITQRNLSTLRYLFLAGEPLDEPTWKWASDVLGTCVIDHYWQTESGWPMLSNMPGVELLPIKPGSPTKPVVGYHLEVVNDDGKRMDPGKKGYLVCHPPLPPGNLLTLWGDDQRYVDSYWKRFPGNLLYATGDFAIEDEEGYFWVLGRADEVINVAGHRLGTREVEEVLVSHRAVAEVVAVGVKDELKGQAIVAFAVLKEGEDASAVIRGDLVRLVRERIGAVAVPREVHFVKMLPKTRSGKVMRRVIKAVAEGMDIGDISTIEDGASVDEIVRALESFKAQLGGRTTEGA